MDLNKTPNQSVAEFQQTDLTFENPAFSRRTAALATAWKGVGLALTNLMNRTAASGPASIMFFGGQERFKVNAEAGLVI